MRVRARLIAFLSLAAASAASAAYEPSLPWRQDSKRQHVAITVDLVLAGGVLGAQRLPWTRYRFLPKTLPCLGLRGPRAGVGLELRNGPGLAIGTTVRDYDISARQWSLLPVTLRASWNTCYDARWHHSSVYASATLHHTHTYYGPSLPLPPPLLQNEFGAGVAITNIVVSTWAEFRVRLTDSPSVGPSVGLAVGLDLGGTYGLGRSATPEY
jgi:hypothetical protein